MNGRPWTTTEARTLEQLRMAQTPVRDIALVLNRTEHAIYSFLRYKPGTTWHRRALQRVGRAPRPSPSERLRVATVRAIMKHAHATGIDFRTAAQRLISEGRG